MDLELLTQELVSQTLSDLWQKSQARKSGLEQIELIIGMGGGTWRTGNSAGVYRERGVDDKENGEMKNEEMK
ncbi:hypothetical protein RRG08_028987 [Elysia crispata]|uniref:Uncharacterized protein n=1 Tax=Elysia crispata TaxID=231223 RepID=A0AAE1BD28_9GAST|nr:hypothetical protein RRG08_028987 [Elysia crispata]